MEIVRTCYVCGGLLLPEDETEVDDVTEMAEEQVFDIRHADCNPRERGEPPFFVDCEE